MDEPAFMSLFYRIQHLDQDMGSKDSGKPSIIRVPLNFFQIQAYRSQVNSDENCPFTIQSVNEQNLTGTGPKSSEPSAWGKTYLATPWK
jgi:hypothetical protein